MIGYHRDNKGYDGRFIGKISKLDVPTMKSKTVPTASSTKYNKLEETQTAYNFHLQPHRIPPTTVQH